MLHAWYWKISYTLSFTRTQIWIYACRHSPVTHRSIRFNISVVDFSVLTEYGPFYEQGRGNSGYMKVGLFSPHLLLDLGSHIVISLIFTHKIATLLCVILWCLFYIIAWRTRGDKPFIWINNGLDYWQIYVSHRRLCHNSCYVFVRRSVYVCVRVCR